MKKTIYILSVCFLLVSATSCIKNNNCNDKTPSSDQPAMTTYAASNGITATIHSSGLNYQIINPGTGTAFPTLASQVSVKYIGKLLDGTTFDSQLATPITLQLGATIPGWQIGIQQLKKGGSMKIIVPSALGYGCAGRGTIPGDAILYFEIELVDFI